MFSYFANSKLIYKTADFGATWVIDTLPFSGTIKEITHENGQYFINSNTGLWRSDLTYPYTFTRIYDGVFGSSVEINAFSTTNSGYWINNNYNNSLFSNDGGNSWQERTKGIVSNGGTLYSICGKLIPVNSNVSFRAAFRSNAQDGEWETNNMQGFGRIIGEANGVIYSYPGYPLLKTTDCGEHWDTLQYPQIELGVSPEGLIHTGNRIYIWNIIGYPILYSDDNGLTWPKVPEPELYATGESVVARGDTILFVSSFSGTRALYRSVNLGQTWENLPLPNNIKIIANTPDGRIIGTSLKSTSHFLGKKRTAALYVSTDLGQTWSQTFQTEYLDQSNTSDLNLKFHLLPDGIIVLETPGDIYISKNEGFNWLKLSGVPFFNLSPIGNNPVAGATAYLIDEGYLYASTNSQGIWRTPFSPVLDELKVLSSEYGFLQGQLYRDFDGNCLYNPAAGDAPVVNKPVSVTSSNLLTNTNIEGKYSIALPVGTYGVSATPPTYYQTNCTPDTLYATIIPGNTVVSNIPFSPLPDQNDLCVLITAPFPARPGFVVSYSVQVSNVGSTSIPASTTTFGFNNLLLEPLSIEPSGQFAGNQVILAVPALLPGQSIVYTLKFTLAPTTPLGTTLTCIAESPLPNDVYPTNNTARSIQTVQGSFDPNDKTALPITPAPPGQVRLLDYLIRFQNTGTDTAFTVVVTDTIEASLNLMSLRNIWASHPYEMYMLPGRVVKWRFRNILLPDSNTNETESHGYLRFQIETNAGLVPGNAIKNDADIFFDFNSPVRTNEFKSDNAKWQVTETGQVILCEGDTWQGEIWTNSDVWTNTSGNAWSDTLSIVQVQVNPSWEIQIDTVLAAGSTLFGTPLLKDTTITNQLFSVEGCDSTIVWHVTIQTSATQDIAQPAAWAEIRPNPTTREACIHFKIAESASFSVELFAPSGQRLRQWESPNIISGNSICLDTGDLASGIYFVWVKSARLTGMYRLVKI